jgi:hypothetical protein
MFGMINKISRMVFIFAAKLSTKMAEPPTKRLKPTEPGTVVRLPCRSRIESLFVAFGDLHYPPAVSVPMYNGATMGFGIKANGR